MDEHETLYAHGLGHDSTTPMLYYTMNLCGQIYLLHIDSSSQKTLCDGISPLEQDGNRVKTLNGYYYPIS